MVPQLEFKVQYVSL